MRRFLPFLVALVLALAPLTLSPVPAQAADCEFVLGFRTLQQMIPDVVGACVDNVQYAPSGDAIQHTTAWHGQGGLLVWRHFDNWTAFTDGYRTWINGPFGLQVRLNVDRFPWETNPAVPPVTAPAVPGDTSRNWSGYAATGGAFTSVTGTWTVASPTATGSPGISSTWVGIGGVVSRDLIQAGTDDTSHGSPGDARYSAWIELLPAPSVTVPLAIRAGDSVTVTISEQSPGRWLIAIVNNTSGQSYRTVVNYASARSSADWVQEAPSARRGGILPLSNFGTVPFTGASATKDGATVSVGAAGGRPIAMTDPEGNLLAVPSDLDSSGAGFSVTRVVPALAGR